ncbi:hypothetical protein GCM10009633_11090 [Janibacter melonis]|uniref:Z1 domain-containing protein n=1 Tax=Janibacter melonis TaxID=262209 RepID=UPI001E5C1338|nr:Z1 domain-containing protein [Janibacter melonis]MCB5991170.1 Z1 domain-containing protein [Janibacter melonis]
MTDQQLAKVVFNNDSNDPLSHWVPVIGGETLSVVESALTDEYERARVLAETQQILARCAGPAVEPVHGIAGLVIGQVQSGKTLSFTTLTAMARDNEIPLVILLAGTKTNLHAQTVARLRSDLRVERKGGISPWAVMTNPDDSATSVAQLATQLKNTLDPKMPPQFRQTTVITVMKNKSRMMKVAGLLAKLPTQGVDTTDLPVILIDDEADQAGMNAGKADGGEKSETPTYATIVELRNKVPNNSYVMYTATPQAPLLISLADSLSPEFVNVLTPGSGYTGGQDFFGSDANDNDFVTVMSAADLSEALDTSSGSPPESLKDALATFLLAKTQMPEEVLSMLVHPSHTKDLHTVYEGYVNSLMSAWSQLLNSAGPDRDELVAAHFEQAVQRLAAGGREVPPLDEMLATLPAWMSVTRVRVVNSDKTSDLTWDEAPAWIVIGGNALDRGFTIQGLAITYMPRGAGVGNADTIQQRARFFGYKKSYQDLCHAWMSSDLAQAYRDYVDHEKHLREEMRQAQADGINLKQWTRKMLLDASMKATRRAVIKLPILHNKFRGGSWTSVDRLGKMPSAKASKNRRAVDLLRARYASDIELDPMDPRTNPGNHRFYVPLGEVLALLADWEGPVEDAIVLQQLTLVMQAHLDDDPTLRVAVYSMDGFEPRKRSLGADGDRVNLAQGRNPKIGYQGDGQSFDGDVLTVQLHNVMNQDGQPVWGAVGLRIRVPEDLSGAAIFQYKADE